jgi:pimeloyl-ACP methyl ester carboxylesterase
MFEVDGSAIVTNMTDANPMAYEELFAKVAEAAQRKGVFVADAAPPDRQICAVDGRNIHFLDWHGDHTPPMLLLHGALLQAHVWDFWSLDMRQHFHIRAVDLPGHGSSDWAPDGDYTRARVAAHVVTLIEQLDLRSLVLLGHSLGGAVGALVAARLADRVRALVMVDSTLLPTGRPSVRTRAAALPQTFASFEQFAQHAAGLGRRQDPARLSTSLRWNARELADGRWTWKYDPAIRDASLGPAGFEDVWSALGAFPHPVLFVRAGEHSHLTDEAADRLQALPNVRLTVLPEAAHNVMTDNPPAFRRVVSEFLSMLGPNTRL